MKNLSQTMARSFPPELQELLRRAGRRGQARGYRVFLVGGAVRDLLLDRVNLDLDIVVEGEAIKLAGELAAETGGRLITHNRFDTATVQAARWSIDLAAARIETYPGPGQLPVLVERTDIQRDLYRRDFTINALAVHLDPSHWGEMVDILNGRRDLSDGLVRVLHSGSFQDDATRIWRAVRYEQRLGFQIESGTLKLIERDLDFLESLSADRLRTEVELSLVEEKPELVFQRASELGLLEKLSAGWRFSRQTGRNLVRARAQSQPYTPPPELTLAVLCSDLEAAAAATLMQRLNFSKDSARAVLDFMSIREAIPELSRPALSRSEIYHRFTAFSISGLLAARLNSAPGIVQERLDLYLNELRQIKISLSGRDLMRAGIPAGPRMGRILEKVKEARLEGRVESFESELALALQISRDEPG